MDSEYIAREQLGLGRVTLHTGNNLLQIHLDNGCPVEAGIDPQSTDTRCCSFDVAEVALLGG